MSNLIFNVGLENNPYDAYGAGMLLKSFGEITKSEVVMGEYEGKPERTLVAEIECEQTIEDVIESVRALSRVTHQECIAFTYDDVGYVLGQFDTWDIEFDSQYFKTL